MRVFLVWTARKIDGNTDYDVDSVWPDIRQADSRRNELFESNKFDMVWVQGADWGPEMKASDFDPSPNFRLTP